VYQSSHYGHFKDESLQIITCTGIDSKAARKANMLLSYALPAINEVQHSIDNNILKTFNEVHKKKKLKPATNKINPKFF